MQRSKKSTFVNILFFPSSSSSLFSFSSSSTSSSSSSSLCVLLMLTMMTVLWSGVEVTGRGVWRSRRSPATDLSGNVTFHMCAAQCNAFCDENTMQCYSVCNKTQGDWIMNCRDMDMQISSVCPGTCSLLRDQDDAGYFIPPKPEVVLERDLTTRSVTLTWSTPDLLAPGPIVYVVQERNEWEEVYLVTGDHFTRHDLDLCSHPTYRVAAVSRYGSDWFSSEHTAPDLVPGKPNNLSADFISYDPRTENFVVTLSWRHPTGWNLSDLAPDAFTWQSTVQCPPGPLVAIPDIIEDGYFFGNETNTLAFHVANFVTGCRIIYTVTAHSRCDFADLISERAYLTVDFSCKSLEDFYSVPTCTPPSINPPGNVKNVRITLIPGVHGARVHVTWSPPSDLGSEGMVGYYTVFYGFIEDTYGVVNLKAGYKNITLPAEVTEADVPIADGEESGNRFGILVMAGAPGQVIRSPIGLVYQVHDTLPDGHVLVDDDDIVVYQLKESRLVQVYWRTPAPAPDRDVTGVALQWGPVSMDQVDVIPELGGDDNSRIVTYNVTKSGDGDVELSASNTTVLEQRQKAESRD